MRAKLAACCALLSTSALAHAVNIPFEAPTSISITERNIALPASESTLATVLEQLYQHRGVDFALAPELAEDLVQNDDLVGGQFAGKALSGYNYAIERDFNGVMTKIVITGRNGDGVGVRSAALKGPERSLLTGAMPERFRSLPPSAVSTLDFALEELFGVPVGGKTPVSLPTGQYAVVHDNVFEHANGDKTWVGYLDGEGTDYRMVVTVGKEGGTGQIVTPQGLFRIETEAGKTWLVNVDAASLQAQTMLGDEIAENARSVRKLRRSVLAKPPVSSAQTAKLSTAVAPPPPSSTPKAVIDLLAYYTPGFSVGSVATRLNHIVAMANQAYIDSQVNIRLRLVYSQQVNYSETLTNSAALTDLSNASGVFSDTETLRTRYGADLVTLLRPFKYSSQGNCGTAWVNGSNGGALRRSSAFSVVSDGRDAGSNFYCADLSLAHELGHNMGSTHDKAHSSSQGKYPYSYGYGKSGVFGTVMSYYNPQLGMFSNPSTLCAGQPCGVADQADNTRSMNQTAAKIAAFTPSVTP
jgi:hypothetical protein